MYIYIYMCIYIYISCMYYMRTGIIHPHLPAKGPTCVDLPRILYRLDATALRPGQRVVIGNGDETAGTQSGGQFELYTGQFT